MRFKKGDNIEVWSNPGMSYGSWQPAEIIHGDGHNYTVKYKGLIGPNGEVASERVSRKAIRPCPPPFEAIDSFVPGDIIEVLTVFSWKIATLVEVLANKNLKVRLIGSSCELIARKCEIRARQSWQNGMWILVGKASRNVPTKEHKEKTTLKCDSNSRSRIHQPNRRINPSSKEKHIPIKHSFKGKRRSPYCISQVAPHAKTRRKLRIVFNKIGSLHQTIASNVSPRNILCENNIDMTFKKITKTTRCAEIAMTNENVNDTDSFTRSSAGSCSSNPYEFPYYFSKESRVEECDGNVSDAESICCGQNKEDSPRKELTDEIHSLELHAYRCTMGVLHALGPLSWEREALVTNLRLSLNISNDEHLMEIRNLISGDTGITVS